MSEELGVLVAKLQLDVSQMRQEFASLQGQLTANMGAMTSALEQMGARGIASATASARGMEQAYAQSWSKISNNAYDFYVKQDTANKAFIDKFNTKSQEQLGIFEAQKVKETQAATQATAEIEQSYLQSWNNISSGAQQYQAKQDILTQNMVEKANTAGLKQQGIFEAQKQADQQTAINFADRLEQINLKQQGMDDARRFAGIQNEETATQKKAKLQADYIDNLEQKAIKQKGLEDYRRFVSTQETEKAAQKKADAEEKADAKMNTSHEDMTNKTLARLQRTLLAIGAVMAIRYVWSGFEQGLAIGIKFNEQMETVRIGITSVIMAQGEFTDSTGQMVQGYTKFTEAQKISDDVIKKLKIDNLETIATFQQLVKAFQQGLAPAMAAGFNIDQVRQYTVAMVQAAGAMGINLDMMAEEMRSLTTGAITPRNSLIATYLGIRAEDIRKYQGDADGLFTFIMKKLESFTIAGQVSTKSFAGLWSNLKDAIEMAMGEGTLPLFNYLKQQFTDLTKYIVTINKTTNEITFNPDIINKLKSVSEIVISLINSTEIVSISFLKWVDMLLTPITMLSKMGDLLKGIDNLLSGGGISKLAEIINTGLNKMTATEQQKVWDSYTKNIENIVNAVKYGQIAAQVMEESQSEMKRMQNLSNFAMIPNKPAITDEQRKQFQEQIQDRYKLITDEYTREIDLDKTKNQTGTTLLKQAYDTKILFQNQYESQLVQMQNQELENENILLLKKQYAVIESFNQQADFIKNNPKFKDTGTGLFTGQVELGKAYTKMIQDTSKIEDQINKNREKEQQNIINEQTKQFQINETINKQGIQEEQQIIGINSSLAQTTDNYILQKQLLQESLFLKIQEILMNKDITGQQQGIIDNLKKQAEFQKEQIDIAKQKKTLSVIENTASSESAYAASIGDIATVNEMLQVQTDIKNKNIDSDNRYYLLNNPEMKSYIDRQKEINQLTTDQQILLNNLSKVSSYADASKQLAELNYNWQDLKAAEQLAIDIEIEGQRIKLAGNQELLAVYEQIYQAKSKNIDLTVREKELTNLQPVFQGAESLYSTTGNESYLNYYKNYIEKMIQLTKDKNAIIFKDDNDRRTADLAATQGYYDKLVQMELTRNNKQLDAYTKLYKATGKQEYLDKTVEIFNKILDNEDYFNNQIVDTEQAAYDLRKIRMQDFYQSLIDMTQQAGDKQIAVAKQTAQTIAGFNIPLAGTNISSMTGMPIGSIGQSFGNTNFPGITFASQSDLDNYMKNFNMTQNIGGLTKLTGPATGGQDVWFKSLQDASKYIEDWKNGLGSATNAQNGLTSSTNSASSAIDQLTSKFQSAYTSFQSFQTDQARKNWTAADWTKEFDRLSTVFQSSTDASVQIDTLNSMLDVLKEIDKLSQASLQAQQKIATDYMNSAKSVDDLINNLKFGGANPGTSYKMIQDQYDLLKTNAIKVPINGVGGATIADVTAFSSFVQNNFLPFMKTYGSGYIDKLNQTINDLGTISDELKGKSTLISLATALGIDLSIKEPITANTIFDFTQLTPIDLKTFTDDPGPLGAKSIFNMINGWDAKKLTLLGNVLDLKDANGNLLSSGWKAKDFGLFTDLINILDPNNNSIFNNNYTGETIHLIGDLFDIKDQNGDSIFTSGWTFPKAATTFDFSSLFTDVGNKDWSKVKLDVDALVGAMGLSGDTATIAATAITDKLIAGLTGTSNTDISGLTGAATAGANSVGNVANNLQGTTIPLQTTGDNLFKLATDTQSKVENMATILNGFFSTLNTAIGTTFSSVSAGNVAGGIQQQAYQIAQNTAGFWFYPSQTRHTLGGYEYIDSTGNWTYAGMYATDIPRQIWVPYPKAAEGVLTSGLTLAGEAGPEYVVPTYEPQHSNFLKTMGVDTNKISDMMVTKQANSMNNFLDKLQAPVNNYEVPKSGSNSNTIVNIDSEKIGKEIAKEITSCLMNVSSNSNGKEIKIQLVVDGKILADVISGQIYNGNSSLIKNIRKAVTGKY